MLGFENPPLPLMELVGGKRKLREKMYRSILSEDEIYISDIPSQNIQRGNGLMLVSIGKILQSLEGCACPMGALSREFLKKLRLAENEIALIDMEAGVEHFGRGIDESIDDVLLSVEPSFESITIAERIKSLAAGIDKNVQAILNKVDSENMAFRLESEVKSRGIEVIGFIPNDVAVFEACLEGRAVSQGKALQAAGKILDLLLSTS
jgi:CO dehydrogenase maturation factor